MGGKPVAALNLAMFPNQPEFFPSLKQIMQGGIDKMSEAGVPVIGGHTIRDKEPKYGFAVLGTIHPGMILENTKARIGDAILLTKKIGTGIISTGIKAGMCSEDVIGEITLSMAALNKRASELMRETGVSTATDITGFGLIGHMHEVLSASKCTARIRAGRVPFFDDAVRLVSLNKAPGGTRANVNSYAPFFRKHSDVTEEEILLLNDAQTSGGLLIFVPEERKERLISLLLQEGILAAHIADVVEENLHDPVRIFIDKK